MHAAQPLVNFLLDVRKVGRQWTYGILWPLAENTKSCEQGNTASLHVTNICLLLCHNFT